jgi:hypothetical protein
MAISPQLQTFAKSFAKKLADEQVAIFAGAGLSAGQGFVDWAGLLAPYAIELGLDIKREKEHLVRLAQYSMNDKGNNRHHLNQNIIEAFPVMHAPSINHEILARLPIDTYWTTNYDKLIETALRNAKKRVDVKYRDSQLPNSTPRRDAVVYKMHGDVEHANEAVLTRDDYESYPRKFPGFLNALSGDLTGKTFLFIGFSFSDPNLEHVLSEVRQRYHGAQREHFCLLRKPKENDYTTREDFLYAQVRQRHFISDLRRFNVTAIEMEEYSEVAETLLAIEQQYRRRSVFVGGSAEDYGPWGQAAVDEFCSSLGALFIDLQLRIVSGFGLGIGNALISGAIDRAYAMNNLQLDSFLDVRPFPRAIPDSARRAQVWHAYRQDLLRIPGIAFFMFGNKKDDAGNIVAAGGVKAEFDIAHAQGVIPIPIGGTGSMAKILADEVLANFTVYCPDGDPVIENFIKKWNNPITNLADCLQDVKTLVEHIKKK